jgi:hypothetical protein
MARVGALARARFAVGVACVAVAAGLLLGEVPRETRSADETLAFYAYVTTAQDRLLTTGDALDIPRFLQVAALQKIPRNADYALLIPATQERAARKGIGQITYDSLAPWFRYLMLPAEPTSRAGARYVICWRCDMAAWGRRVVWVWREDSRMGIGRVRR